MIDAGYRLFETSPFLKKLESLPPLDRERLRRKLDTHVYPHLRVEPHRGPWIKKLKGYRPWTWRYRMGPWRLFYEIDETNRVVLVTAVTLRRDAYR